MRDLIVELKQLRLHGMAAGWAELLEQNNVEVASSQWLLERLLQAESADRAVRSVSHQMNAAQFPVHRDIAGFDFDGSPVDRQLVMQLASMTFTEGAHNLVLVGGPGSGRTAVRPATPRRAATLRHGCRAPPAPDDVLPVRRRSSVVATVRMSPRQGRRSTTQPPRWRRGR